MKCATLSQFEKTFSLILFMFVLSSAHAQTSCQQAAQNAQSQCSSAIQSASGTPAVFTGTSLAQGAAAQAVGSQIQMGSMSSAINTCNQLKASCQQSCSGSPSSPGRPGGGSDGAGTPATPYQGDPNMPQCQDSAGDPRGKPGCSPLVVQLGTTPLQMTAPEDGVWYNILGERATPKPNTPVKISWPTKDSLRDNYFLTLPNHSGNVLGIDELFGNNTLGPDRLFAANGFEALKKFDGRRDDGSIDPDLQDGVINASDPIFADLRLWRDLNGNGVAEHDELFTLSELGIVLIDLNYDPNFVETDRYGNSIHAKSVVEMIDHQVKLIFDLWFHS